MHRNVCTMKGEEDMMRRGRIYGVVTSLDDVCLYEDEKRRTGDRRQAIEASKTGPGMDRLAAV